MIQLYRYTSYVTSGNELRVVISSYEVIKETKSCYVISCYPNKPKYILKDPNGKRFAYLTKEDAYSNLMKRTKLRKKFIDRDKERVDNLLLFVLENKNSILNLSPKKLN